MLRLTSQARRQTSHHLNPVEQGHPPARYSGPTLVPLWSYGFLRPYEAERCHGATRQRRLAAENHGIADESTKQSRRWMTRLTIHGCTPRPLIQRECATHDVDYDDSRRTGHEETHRAPGCHCQHSAPRSQAPSPTTNLVPSSCLFVSTTVSRTAALHNHCRSSTFAVFLPPKRPIKWDRWPSMSPE